MKAQSSPLLRPGYALAVAILVASAALEHCPAAVAADVVFAAAAADAADAADAAAAAAAAAAAVAPVDFVPSASASATCHLDPMGASSLLTTTTTTTTTTTITTTTDPAASSSPLASAPREKPGERCRPRQAPPEHADDACDRHAQNSRRLSEHSRIMNLPREELTRDHVYLDLPEERTWRCPPDDDLGIRSLEHRALGAPARWVVHNRSSGPVRIARVDERGAEVPAAAAAAAKDGGPAWAAYDMAVWPRGPVLLPGSTAVVEGRQGHAYAVREYEEVLVPSFVDGVLPRTASAPPDGRWTRFARAEAGGALLVSGNPGRVLMTHVMGNVHVRNDYGAPCPVVLYDHGGNAGRRGTPKSFNPNCNVLNKAFVNVVGCPVDVYFSPPDRDRGGVPAGEEGPTLEERACEVFVRHLGPLGPFLASDPTTRNLDDGWKSPLSFQSTYNRHSFVARMSHDGSLVARIDVDRDEVTDCPGPAGRAAPLGGAEGREGTGEGEGASARASNSTWFLRRAALEGAAIVAVPTRCSDDAKAGNSDAASCLAGVISASARIAA